MLRFILMIVLLPLLSFAAHDPAPTSQFKINIMIPKNETTWFLGNVYQVSVNIKPALTDKEQAVLWINNVAVKKIAGTGKTETIIFTDLDPLTVLRVGENTLKVQVKESESENLKIYRWLPKKAVACIKHG